MWIAPHGGPGPVKGLQIGEQQVQNFLSVQAMVDAIGHALLVPTAKSAEEVVVIYNAMTAVIKSEGRVQAFRMEYLREDSQEDDAGNVVYALTWEVIRHIANADGRSLTLRCSNVQS